MKFLELDSPFMQVMNRIADLLILNVLTLICCIPIFTAGAAFTALHYMLLKIVRNEESYIVRGFFKSFKQNFKQATIIWLLLLLVAIIFAGDYYVILNSGMEFGYWFKAVLGAILILVVFTTVMVFPFLAKFSNTVLRTLKNALAVSVLQFPKTILMLICYAIPVVLGMTFIQIFPIVFLFGISAPAYVSALLYNKYFKMLEERIMEAQGIKPEVEEDPDRIFSDKLDESLAKED